VVSSAQPALGGADRPEQDLLLGVDRQARQRGDLRDAGTRQPEAARRIGMVDQCSSQMRCSRRRVHSPPDHSDAHAAGSLRRSRRIVSFAQDRREAAAENHLDAAIPELDQQRSDADAAVDQGQSAFGHPEPVHDSRFVRFKWAFVS